MEYYNIINRWCGIVKGKTVLQTIQINKNTETYRLLFISKKQFTHVHIHTTASQIEVYSTTTVIWN